MAAAIGVGLPVTEPSGNMIVDIGGGTTEVAVISLAGIVYADSIRVGGDEMDEAIVQYIKRKYNLLIGERTAEDIKITIGSRLARRTSIEPWRSRAATSSPACRRPSRSRRTRSARPCASRSTPIVEAVKIALERTPPELAADIVDKGIVLTGGGALLRNLDVLLREETGLPVMVADDPLTAVAIGTGRTLDELPLLKDVAIRS